MPNMRLVPASFLQAHPLADMFLAEAEAQGCPLSQEEAIFLSKIQCPCDGLEQIPKELLERLQKYGVANSCHHPDF